MKKVISALIVVIVIVAGAVYFASNKVEENYQRIVDRLNDVNGFKVSENSYQKGLLGSKGSFDLVVSKDLLKNLAGKDVDEDLKFKIENEISHSVLAFINGFDIDSKISIQNEAVKNIVASFLGSNVIATAKTKASVSGDKDVNVKFSDIDFSDKQTMNIHTKDVKFGLKLDAKNNVDNANIEVGKIAFQSYDEYKDSIEAEGVYIDTAYTTRVGLSKIFESKISPYVANAKFKKVALLSESEGDIVVDDFDYKSKFEISNDLGSSNDVIKIGAVTVSKLKYTDFAFESKLSNINVSAINKVLDKLSSTNGDKSVLDELNFDEIFGQILEKNPNLKISNLSFKNGDKSLKLNLDAAVNGFKSGSTQLEIFDKLSLEGKLSVDESLAKFFDTAFPEMALFEPTLISTGYLKEEGKKVVSDFKYDPSKKDVIFNGKVGLQNFFMGF